MKKILILAVIAVAAYFLWDKVSSSGDSGPLAGYAQRLDAAEQSFQQAGRAAGLAGVDTTAGAGSALSQVKQVQRELRDMAHRSTSAEDKEAIEKLLARAEQLERKMG